MRYLSKIFLILLILLAVPIYADREYYNGSVLGYSMNTKGEIRTSTAIDTDIEGLQTSNAEDETQLLTQKAVFELKKANLLRQADDGWDIIKALFILIYDSVILIMYWVEMRLMLYVLIELIPDIFIKMRDRIANIIVQRIK